MLLSVHAESVNLQYFSCWDCNSTTCAWVVMGEKGGGFSHVMLMYVSRHHVNWQDARRLWCRYYAIKGSICFAPKSIPLCTCCSLDPWNNFWRCPFLTMNWSSGFFLSGEAFDKGPGTLSNGADSLPSRVKGSCRLSQVCHLLVSNPFMRSSGGSSPQSCGGGPVIWYLLDVLVFPIVAT